MSTADKGPVKLRVVTAKQIMTDFEKTVRPSVISDGKQDLVCQRCLVKWARVRVLDRVFCVRCGNVVREKAGT